MKKKYNLVLLWLICFVLAFCGFISIDLVFPEITTRQSFALVVSFCCFYWFNYIIDYAYNKQ